MVGLILHIKLDEIFNKTDKAKIETAQDNGRSDSNEKSPSFEDIVEETKINKLKLEIQALQIGSDPTIEILQTRDTIISEINTVSNPDIRNELLKSLEEKENI